MSTNNESRRDNTSTRMSKRNKPKRPAPSVRRPDVGSCWRRLSLLIDAIVSETTIGPKQAIYVRAISHQVCPVTMVGSEQEMRPGLAKGAHSLHSLALTDAPSRRFNQR